METPDLSRETDYVGEHALEPDPATLIPPQLWGVYLAQDVLLYSRASRPNSVRRFFLWAFFGWRWEPLKNETKS